MQSPAILIVDDEADIRSLLERHLRKEGFRTLTAASGAQALECIERWPLSLVLLDLLLPDMRGTDVCRRIRSNPRTAELPVIVCSALGEEIDRVVGFEIGADDYLVKSDLSLRELTLRIRAVLRRRAPASPPEHDVGDLLRLDRAGHRAFVAGREVPLTPTELALLSTLVDHAGRAMTRTQLLQQVWADELDPRTVDTHVKRLREKLEEAASVIVTVRGVGYRLEPGQARRRSRGWSCRSFTIVPSG